MMADTSGNCASCYFDSTFGYYTLSGGACALCNVAGCASYSTSCQCLTCQPGYQFINSHCVACQNLHCTDCQKSISSCQGCATGYGRLSSACILCTMSNCVNCDGDSTVCQTCANGYYLSGGMCYSCQSSCVTCLSNTVCLACTAGYYLQSNGRCQRLPTHCQQVDSNYISNVVAVCKVCTYGYIAMNGNCYPCSTALFNVIYSI